MSAVCMYACSFRSGWSAGGRRLRAGSKAGGIELTSSLFDRRDADTPQFRERVLELFSRQLKLQGWTEPEVHESLLPLHPDNIRLKRISGAFTNAVFFASYRPPLNASTIATKQAQAESMALPPTVLLRVYGVGSEVLLSRRAELLILHTLSSLYEIGPHILGTFANGRVEGEMQRRHVARARV